MLDIPNERSSHHVPTPRGGGLAIVVVSTVAFAFMTAAGQLEAEVLAALAGGGVAVAAVGFVDDWRSLSPLWRLLVHIFAAVLTLMLFGGLPALQVGTQLVTFGYFGYVLGLLAIVWILNLFNFMDGIDGIAASEAAFVTFAAAAIGWLSGEAGSVSMAALIFASASCGFLALNWQPAKIFLGDVGSGYLGYVIAVLAIAAARESAVSLFVWLILGGAFFTDATVTILRRLLRGDRVFEAHRSHAYQHLALRWRSHSRVTSVMLLINVCWLLPAAWLATVYPHQAIWLTVGSLTPLAIAAFLCGAGQPGNTQTARPVSS